VAQSHTTLQISEAVGGVGRPTAAPGTRRDGWGRRTAGCDLDVAGGGRYGCLSVPARVRQQVETEVCDGLACKEPRSTNRYDAPPGLPCGAFA